MKLKNKNKFKKITRSVSLRILYLSVFLSHFLFGHTFLNSYILCYEEDGKVVLESFSEQQECCNPEIVMLTTPSTNNQFVESVDNCKDVFVIGSCEEDNSTLAAKITYKFFGHINIQYVNLEISNPINDFFITYSQKLNISPQLESYKTISLLI